MWRPRNGLEFYFGDLDLKKASKKMEQSGPIKRFLGWIFEKVK